MRISDWSSDVCSSDLLVLLRIVGQLQWLNEPAQQRIRFDAEAHRRPGLEYGVGDAPGPEMISIEIAGDGKRETDGLALHQFGKMRAQECMKAGIGRHWLHVIDSSEEHTSELQSLLRITYDIFCLKTKLTTTK